MNKRCERLMKSVGADECVYISSFAGIFYYSGFTSPDAALVITHDGGYILTDSRYTIQAHEESPDFVLSDISKTEEVFKQVPEKTVLIEEDNLTVAGLTRLKRRVQGKSIREAGALISKPRRVKDADEIRRIAEAERLGDEAFSYILPRIKAGRTEREIALELEQFMKANGASGLSFDTISAAGVRSAMPHAKPTDKVIEIGDFLTLDFGCILDGYCSDMTRTVVIGRANEQQEFIYSTVLQAQECALSVLCAGKVCSDMDAVARGVITAAGYGDAFGHSLGHSVGIEIHEMPTLSPKCHDILEVGNVVTVEPGIYVDGFGGVRIEDLTVITADGVKNLTKSSKSLIII